MIELTMLQATFTIFPTPRRDFLKTSEGRWFIRADIVETAIASAMSNLSLQCFFENDDEAGVIEELASQYLDGEYDAQEVDDLLEEMQSVNELAPHSIELFRNCYRVVDTELQLAWCDSSDLHHRWMMLPLGFSEEDMDGSTQ